jgi:nickel transport protein
MSLSFAHKVNLFITNENDNLEIYSYFANGKPCINCEFTVKSEDKVIFKNKLNTEGIFLYKPTSKNIEITIDAGSGHIAQQKVTVDNIKHEEKKEHVKEEKKIEYIKIILGLVAIFLLFFLLKRFKK